MSTEVRPIEDRDASEWASLYSGYRAFTVRERFTLHVHRNRAATTQEQAALDKVLADLEQLLTIDSHLRHIAVGQHPNAR